MLKLADVLLDSTIIIVPENIVTLVVTGRQMLPLYIWMAVQIISLMS